MEEMKVSVIVPSYNGAEKLPQLMEALSKQRLSPSEVIVVLDGSTDESKKVLGPWVHKLPLKIVNQENHGRAGARNRGAAESVGNVLIFYDDDMIPDGNSLQRHLELQRENDGRLVSGAVKEDTNCATEICEWRRYLLSKWMGEGQSPGVLNENEIGLSAANFSIRKKIFEKLGGFDPELRDCEDFDLGVRAFFKGFDLVHDPVNTAIHEGFPSMVAYALRQREYRKAQSILKDLRNREPFAKQYDKYFEEKKWLNKLIYFFFPGITLTWIDSGYFSFIPDRFRFAFYSRVFSALTLYYPNRSI
jgi:glycosyltransferase involved in cell wall biosynthesis